MKFSPKPVELTDALVSLMEKFGESWGFSVTGFGVPNSAQEYADMVTFDKGNNPGWSVVQQEIKLLQDQAIAEEYKYNRLNAYPNIADQLDMLWHAIDEGNLDKTSNFYQTLKSIKDANPKTV